MQQSDPSPADPDANWPLSIRLAPFGVFCFWMMYEWNRWPNGGAQLGPLGLIWYNGLDGFNLVLCWISLLLLFAFPLKPHPITAAISILGGLNWLVWGVLAKGIGC